MPNGYKQLYRSRTNRLIGGVCGGLGHFFGVDPTLVRLLFVVVGIIGQVFPALIIYIVMMLVVPEEPLGEMPPATGESRDTGPETTVTSAGKRSTRKKTEVFEEKPPEASGE